MLEELGKKKEHRDLVEEIRYYNENEETYKKLKANMLEMTFEQATAGIRRDAFEHGEQKGLKLGEKKGIIKTAISMLKEGIEVSLIKKVTGLTEKEILNGENEIEKISCENVEK